MSIAAFLMLMSVLLPGSGAVSLNAQAGLYSVADFGAVGDGETDDLRAFQQALDTAGARGGGVVQVPAAQFLIKGSLRLPKNVTLEGLWRAPQRGAPPEGLSTLLAVSGRGDTEGEPFLRMGENSTLKGLTIFYPEQIKANPPIPYPWTVQADGPTDNLTIRDVTMINPYQAVDLGTYPTGRHYVANLYGYPLFKGIYINQCYDVGRIENIHFWPFWDIDPNSPLWEFTKENAVSFIIGKTDGQMGHNLFSIFYKIGMHFIAGPIPREGGLVDYQAGSGMYSNCYLDVTPCAIQVDAAMPSAGVSFVNSSIMSRVVVGPENRGPVKFTGTGFWATSDLVSHAELEGNGTVFFNSCHFSNWDRLKAGAPCIDANVRRLVVTGNDFDTTRRGHVVLRLGQRTRSAVITSNLMPGGQHIVNEAPNSADVQIALNSVEPEPSFVNEWLLLGPFPNDPQQGGKRIGFDIDYLATLGGESTAELTVETPVETGDGQILNVRTARVWDSGMVDLHQLHPDPYLVAYAQTWLYSPRAQEGWIEMGMNDGGKVWLNAALVYERYSPQGAEAYPGQDVFPIPLQEGWNRLLVKIEDGGGSRWRFLCEAYDAEGAPLTARAAVPE